VTVHIDRTATVVPERNRWRPDAPAPGL